MDWENLVSSFIGILVLAAGTFLAIRKRRKTASVNVERFSSYLQESGIRAEQIQENIPEKKVGVSRASNQKAEGTFKIKGKDFDYINVVSTTTQYGVNYHLNFLVASTNSLRLNKRKKTRMVKKKSPSNRKMFTDVVWSGDVYLSQELNYDSGLKDRLLQSELEQLKSGILIYPETKHAYVRIRTDYLLPSPNLLESINIIAKHVKSGW